MPLTKKGTKIKAAMQKEYGGQKEGNEFSTPAKMPGRSKERIK